MLFQISIFTLRFQPHIVCVCVKKEDFVERRIEEKKE